MNKVRTSPVEDLAGAPPQHKPNLPQRMLAFSTRRLLTEKSSVTVNSFLLGEQRESLTVHAIMATVLTEEIQGNSHFGLND